jgi:hypothetical protein
MDSLTVIDGQELQNVGPRFAALKFAGNSIRLLDGAIIRFHTSWAELVTGGVSVNTSTKFVLRSNCFSVHPLITEFARYSITRSDGRIYIWAEHGDLTLKGRKEVRVAESKTYAITACGEPGEVIEPAVLDYTKWKVLFGIANGVAIIPPLVEKMSPP